MLLIARKYSLDLHFHPPALSPTKYMPESEFAVSDMYIFTILILVLYLDYVTVGYSGQNRSVFRRGAFQMHE